MGSLALRKKPSVFEYDNYRLFLGDMYCHYKESTTHFSYRYFSQRAGFGSPNFLKLVISGERNLTASSIPKVAKGLKLNKTEEAFFQDLVYFNQADTPTKRAKFGEKLLSTRAKAKVHPLQRAEFDYYRYWYYVPLRELVACAGFKEDLDWVAEQFDHQLSTQQIAKALRDLEALQLIGKNADGQWEQTHGSLKTGNEVSNSLVTNYHKKMMQKAAESIDVVPREERDISSVCVPVSEDTMKEMKKRVQKFRQELMAFAAQEQSVERVYQINFQIFPLTGNSSESDQET